MTKHCPLRYLLPKSTHMHFSSGFYLSPKSGNFSKEKHLVTLLAPLTSASLRPCPCAEGYPSCYPHGTTRDDIAGRVARLHQRPGSSVVCALGSLCGVTVAGAPGPGRAVWGSQKPRVCEVLPESGALPPARLEQRIERDTAVQRKEKRYENGEERLPDGQRPQRSGRGAQ